ncbi:VPLPA-CTERM sorting domain-containing protein [uncultured Jannaschia sp.]|uniref:VPLPA-CTERM sorting domain-containing protein n=1 Tax=uncultured Jannaschia sp. TaxID=293347 RepID=UPI0026291986|nr:VPLPA-CTERM sorting domain-containing protein [uncultured Jannaschia sp.]
MTNILETVSGGAVALVLTMAAAQAATVSLERDYGTGAGKVDPGGNDALRTDAVMISDQSDSRFSDVFDLTSLADRTIESFDLTLTFAKAGPEKIFNFATEAWFVRVQGSDRSAGAVSDDFIAMLDDAQSPMTFRIDAQSDANNQDDAFASSVANGAFEFWFTDEGFLPNTFALDSARLDVTVADEISPVPLPATLPLLLAGFGGFAALRRRTRAA